MEKRLSSLLAISIATLWAPFYALCQTPVTTPFNLLWADEFVAPSSNHPKTNLDINKWRAPWSDWHRWIISLPQEGDCSVSNATNLFKAFRTDHNDNHNVVVFSPDPNETGDGIVTQRIIPLPRGTVICSEDYDVNAAYFYDACCAYLSSGQSHVVSAVGDPIECGAECFEFEWMMPAWFQSKQEFKYGYFEARVKLPTLPNFPNGSNSSNYGIGPNFWLYNTTDANLELPNTDYSEIDIVEIIGHNSAATNYQQQNHVYTFNSHVKDASGNWHRLVNEPEYPVVWNHVDFQAWRTFSAFWTPNFIRYYLDNECVFEYDTDGSQYNPMSILIDMNFWNFGEIFDPSHSTIPYEYSIDYAKVHQLPTLNCNNQYVGCDVVPVNFGGIWRSIEVGGGGCNEIVNQKTSLIANESVTIRKNMEFLPNTHLYVDIIPCHDVEIYNQ